MTANRECLIRLSLFAMDSVLTPLAAELQQINSLLRLGGRPSVSTTEGGDIGADIEESQLIVRLFVAAQNVPTCLP